MDETQGSDTYQQVVVRFTSVNHATLSQRGRLIKPLSSKEFTPSAIQFYLHDLEKTRKSKRRPPHALDFVDKGACHLIPADTDTGNGAVRAEAMAKQGLVRAMDKIPPEDGAGEMSRYCVLKAHDQPSLSSSVAPADRHSFTPR